MITQVIDMDAHACLWPSLVVHTRHVAGPEDVTVGTHPQLGLCIVSHYGLSSRVEWMTRAPIPDALIRFRVDEKPVLVFTPFEAAFAQFVEMIVSDATAPQA